MIYNEKILQDDEYYQELIASIDTAKETIDFETYTFENDDIGKKIATQLCQAADKGVKIRIIVDGVGTPNWGNSLTKELEAHRIKTRVYHPLPWILSHWNMTSHFKSSFMTKLKHFVLHINSRNHRKICIIDNNIVLIGSANISQCYVKKALGFDSWRDTSVKITNAQAKALLFSFERVWREKKFLSFKRKYFMQKVDPVFRLNDTFNRRYHYYHSLLQILNHCHSRIWITNAYFLPDTKILNALLKAAKKNVDVRIILPAQTDVVLSSLLAKTFYSRLIDGGVKIYEYRLKVLHTKTFIIDDIYYVGSSNINFRSIKHDLEVDVKIETDDAKKILREAFLKDVSDSALITRDEVIKQSFFTRLTGQMLLYLKYWF